MTRVAQGFQSFLTNLIIDGAHSDLIEVDWNEYFDVF